MAKHNMPSKYNNPKVGSPKPVTYEVEKKPVVYEYDQDEEVEKNEPSLENMQFVIIANYGVVNFRKSPSKEKDNIISEQVVGTEFVLLEEDGDWCRVQSLDTPPVEGFIMKQFLSKVEK